MIGLFWLGQVLFFILVTCLWAKILNAACRLLVNPAEHKAQTSFLDMVRVFLAILVCLPGTLVVIISLIYYEPPFVARQLFDPGMVTQESCVESLCTRHVPVAHCECMKSEKQECKVYAGIIIEDCRKVN